MPGDLNKPFIKTSGVGALQKSFQFNNVHPGSITVFHQVILQAKLNMEINWQFPLHL